MSANPTNASPRIPEEQIPEESSAPNLSNPTLSNTSQPARTPAYHAPGREGLQALLAFSSLQDQIRQRKVRGLAGSGPSRLNEQFVPDEILQLISERALAITGADGVAIALADGGEVRCRAASGPMAPDVGVRLDPNAGFSGACIRSGLIVRCDDTENDPRVDQAACHRIGVQSMVAVPLLTEQGVAGLIAAFCRGKHAVSDSDIRSLSLLAELALTALQPEENLYPAQHSLAQENETLTEAAESPATHSTDHAAANEENSDAVQEVNLPNLESLRNTLSRVTEERIAAEAEQEEAEHYVFSQLEPPGKSLLLRAAILGLLCLALAASALTLWWWRSHKHAGAPPAASEAESNATPSSSPAQSGSETPAVPAQQSSPQEVAGTREVTGLRHWSSADSSTVAIDLQEQVQYEAHQLSDPARIYFDLPDTTLAAGVPGTIEVGDALLSRIRVAQPTSGMTRVVLETKDNPQYSVTLESNPYRLVIELHSANAKPKTSSKVDLFAPLNAAGNSPARAATPERGTWLAPAAISGSEVAALRGPGRGLRIVLDAGHGGWDMGTIGHQGLMEKDLVLDIVARLGKLITQRFGADVIYTRRDDTYIPLEKRTEIANLAQADMFLSVHANYSDSPSARGVETYYTNTYSSAQSRMTGAPDDLNLQWLNVDIHQKTQESRLFADDVQQALYRSLIPKSPALRDRGVKEASYVVLTGTTMPAILAEVSFVSSPEDETKLEDAAYRQRIAEGLYKGVVAFAESRRHVNLASASTRASGQ